jgi:hypothetical protein
MQSSLYQAIFEHIVCEIDKGVRIYRYAPRRRLVHPALIEQAERFFANTGANIRFGSENSYAPNTDRITIRPRERCKDEARYFKTACHELIHWTAAPSRLNRVLDQPKSWPNSARRSCAPILKSPPTSSPIARPILKPTLPSRPSRTRSPSQRVTRGRSRRLSSEFPYLRKGTRRPARRSLGSRRAWAAPRRFAAPAPQNSKNKSPHTPGLGRSPRSRLGRG